jgi:hypothetical protein
VNRVSNPTFDGPSLPPWTWTGIGSGFYRYVPGTGSTYALGLATNTGGLSQSYIKQSLATTAGQTYTVSFSYFSLDGNGATYLQCSFDNSAGTSYNINYNGITKGVWKTFQNTFVASSSSTMITLKLVASTVALAYLDQISVVTPC